MYPMDVCALEHNRRTDHAYAQIYI